MNKPVSQLIEEYAYACVEDMDIDTLCILAREALEEQLSGRSDAQIIETVRQYYPHLLED